MDLNGQQSAGETAGAPPLFNPSSPLDVAALLTALQPGASDTSSLAMMLLQQLQTIQEVQPAAPAAPHMVAAAAPSPSALAQAIDLCLAQPAASQLPQKQQSALLPGLQPLQATGTADPTAMGASPAEQLAALLASVVPPLPQQLQQPLMPSQQPAQSALPAGEHVQQRHMTAAAAPGPELLASMAVATATAQVRQQQKSHQQQHQQQKQKQKQQQRVRSSLHPNPSLVSSKGGCADYEGLHALGMLVDRQEEMRRRNREAQQRFRARKREAAAQAEAAATHMLAEIDLLEEENEALAACVRRMEALLAVRDSMLAVFAPATPGATSPRDNQAVAAQASAGPGQQQPGPEEPAVAGAGGLPQDAGAAAAAASEGNACTPIDAETALQVKQEQDSALPLSEQQVDGGAGSRLPPPGGSDSAPAADSTCAESVGGREPAATADESEGQADAMLAGGVAALEVMEDELALPTLPTPEDPGARRGSGSSLHLPALHPAANSPPPRSPGPAEVERIVSMITTEEDYYRYHLSWQLEIKFAVEDAEVGASRAAAPQPRPRPPHRAPAQPSGHVPPAGFQHACPAAIQMRGRLPADVREVERKFMRMVQASAGGGRRAAGPGLMPGGREAGRAWTFGPVPVQQRPLAAPVALKLRRSGSTRATAYRTWSTR